MICGVCKKEKTREDFHLMKSRRRGFAYLCKDCKSKENHRYWIRHRDEIGIRRGTGKGFRMAILNLLGNKCAVCGFTDKRVLQVDHINGGGIRDRGKKNSRDYWSEQLQKGESYVREKFQTLCANCNWIKVFENREVPKNRLGC